MSLTDDTLESTSTSPACADEEHVSRRAADASETATSRSFLRAISFDSSNLIHVLIRHELLPGTSTCAVLLLQVQYKYQVGSMIFLYPVALRTRGLARINPCSTSTRHAKLVVDSTFLTALHAGDARP